MQRIADERGVTMSQVALNWVRNLDSEEMSDLTKVSASRIPDYVQGFLESNAGIDTWTHLGTLIPD